jgi:hypothetical protein
MEEGAGKKHNKHTTPLKLLNNPFFIIYRLSQSRQILQ